jgi:hypothetical protein
LTGGRNFADRRGASTVMVGNADGLVGEVPGSAGIGLTASGADCARADAI